MVLGPIADHRFTAPWNVDHVGDDELASALAAVRANKERAVARLRLAEFSHDRAKMMCPGAVVHPRIRAELVAARAQFEVLQEMVYRLAGEADRRSEQRRRVVERVVVTEGGDRVVVSGTEVPEPKPAPKLPNPPPETYLNELIGMRTRAVRQASKSVAEVDASLRRLTEGWPVGGLAGRPRRPDLDRGAAPGLWWQWLRALARMYWRRTFRRELHGAIGNLAMIRDVPYVVAERLLMERAGDRPWMTAYAELLDEQPEDR